MEMSIEKFLEELKANGKAENTYKTHLYNLTDANRWKPIEQWKKDDVNKYILHTQEKCKPGTVEVKKMILKRYFTWAGKAQYIEHIKVKMPKNNLKREDLLTIEDINLMIETTQSTMYKALIAFLFESGARISEVLSVKVSDITETDRGMIINLYDSKNDQYRRGLYVYSAGYIRNHIAYNGLQKDSLLFKISGAQSWKMLNKIAKQAGITKPMSPHKFRHAQATDMMRRGYQESIIRKKLGWTADSDMIARYQKCIDDDVIEATADKTGQDMPKSMMSIMTPAEPLKLTDVSMQLRKLTEENEELKAKLARFEEFEKKINRPEFWSAMQRIEKIGK